MVADVDAVAGVRVLPVRGYGPPGLSSSAVARGELAADADPDVVIETLLGPLWLRFLLTGRTLDDAVLDQIADLVAAGAAARR